MAGKPSREPWHYDAIKGRPKWSKELGRQAVLRRQSQHDRTRSTGIGRT